MDGTIDVAPEVGKATVTCRFPCRRKGKETKTSPEMAALAENRKPVVPISVLVVDDSAINRAVAKVSRSGWCGRDRSRRERVAAGGVVVFMDCQMPGMDGYEATRQIRCKDVAQVRLCAHPDAYSNSGTNVSRRHGPRPNRLGRGTRTLLARTLPRWCRHTQVAAKSPVNPPPGFGIRRQS